MMKFIHLVFLLSVVLHVVARATESSESESVDSSRSSSSEELRYQDSLEELAKAVDDAGNSTAIEEVKDTDTSDTSKDKKHDDDETLEKIVGEKETDLEKFDKGLDSDKKEYVQKRAHADSDASMESKGNSTESLTEDDMSLMDQLNKTMGTDEEESLLKSNETVLGIDTFGAQGI